MSKKCARCNKTVYTTEEFKCFDKLWHKQCFKCQSCGMVLNMINYKGFEKEPYCEADINLIACVYEIRECPCPSFYAETIENRHIPKAKATTVTETPELRRLTENTKIQSNVKYHEDFERAKGKLTQVADDPETQRLKQNSLIQSNVAYHGGLKKKAEMELKRKSNILNDQQEMKSSNTNILIPITSWTSRTASNLEGKPVKNSPYSARQSTTLIYSSNNNNKTHENANYGRSVGCVADLDPVNNIHGSLSKSQIAQVIIKHPSNDKESVSGKKENLNKSDKVYRAMYDYDAAESDEVSFVDGDIILNCVPVHDGWFSGIVQRTGKKGLLPSNYVQLMTTR